MKVKELLEYQSFVTKRATPSDMMNEGDLNLHWSESKGEHIDLVDMDLVHLIRSYSKCLDGNVVSDTNILVEKLDSVSRIVASAKDLLVDKS
jgi:hypothetical protein|tara:strand:- start:1670 stop:1945 length:276 start_codon:yes stop_codon:yes gene_type:complete